MTIKCEGCPLESKRNALPLSLSKSKPYAIITKPPSDKDIRVGNVMPGGYGSVLKDALADDGLYINKDFNVIPYVRCVFKKDELTTKEKKAVTQICRTNMADVLAHIEPKVIIPLGGDPASAVAGKRVQITKVSGVAEYNEEFDSLVLPMSDPAIVKIRVEKAPLFYSDVKSFIRLVDNKLKIDQDGELFGDYSYIDDIGFIVEDMPELLCIDTETESFNYSHEDKRLLTIQFCYEAGTAYTLSWDHPDSVLSDSKKDKVIKDLTRLIFGGVKFTGANLKYDMLWLHAKLGITLPIHHDAVLLFSLLDENSYDKNLSALTKRYISSLAGYDDQFNKEVDKSKMIEYPLDNKWLNYSACDSDAGLQVTQALIKEVKKDKELYNYYEKVTIPGINAFAEMEKDGIIIDIDKLHTFRGMLSVKVLELRHSLLNRIPRAIRRKHMEKGLKFTRGDFVRDILFDHPAGFKFKPQVFTDTTKNLPDKSMRLASTSTKQHLPYFLPHKFVEDLIEYIKLERMLGTNVISYEKKYVHPDGKLYPSHSLSTATTGRVASSNPNVMNAPSRGVLAKPYKEIFSAPENCGVVAADFSQLELRIAAHEAQDKEMIQLYNAGQDIHARTAASVMDLTLEEFYRLPESVIKEKRFGAKGVNFGYLFSMLSKTYVAYAKTQYGIEVTAKEAEAFRAKFFNTYRHLLPWHKKMDALVHKDRQVRSVLGRLRHLPQIDSSDFMTEIEAVRMAINFPVQSAGSDLGVMALSRLIQEVDKSYIYPRQFIHDAIYCYVPLKYMAWATITLKWYMESNPIYEWFNFDFSVPIVAEPEIGLNQGSLIEVSTTEKSVHEIEDIDLEFIDQYRESLEEKGCILPVQEIPPNMGLKYIPRRRR